MNVTLKMFFLAFFSLIFIASCETVAQRPEVPANTIGSFNFVKTKDNKFKIVVLNKRGKKVDLPSLMDEKSKYYSKTKLLPGQKENEVRLFFEDGSCTVYVCAPFVPCSPVVIDDDAKCAQLKP